MICKYEVIFPLIGVVVNIILVGFLIWFNLRQLKLTEKAANVAHGTLVLTHYSEIEVTKSKTRLYRGFHFDVSANVPTRLIRYKGVDRKKGSR